MKKKKTTRKSHCGICGKRLSEKTDSGMIRWQPGHVDDTGIYCESCYVLKKNGQEGKIKNTGYVHDA